LQLPLHKIHQALGAQFAVYGTWELPRHYGDPLQEYRSLRENLALADISHQGLLLVTGADHTSFLNSLISNDLPKAGENAGTYAFFLTAKGKILADFFLYPLPEGLLMVLDYENVEKTQSHFMRFRLRSKVEMKTPAWGRLLVSGPKAPKLIEKYIGEGLPALQEKSFFEKEIDGARLICIKRSITGETDFHLYTPLEKLEPLWHRLLSDGAEWDIRPLAQDALEIARIEAGVPRYGTELNDNILPVEAGLQNEGISYSKGCFPGQEVIARLKTYGHVNRKLSGLIFEGEDLPEPGAKVFQGEKAVGWLTSAAHSPKVGKIIAMAYLRREVLNPGIRLTVSVNSAQVLATVATLPFYSNPLILSKSNDIVR